MLQIGKEIAFSILIKEVINRIWKNENLGQIVGKILSILEHWSRVARKGMKS